jgi:hypothetical protein
MGLMRFTLRPIYLLTPGTVSWHNVDRRLAGSTADLGFVEKKTEYLLLLGIKPRTSSSKL